MRIKFIPGERVTIHMREQDTNKSFSFETTVLVVHRTSIVVPEFESQNGLARVRCNGNSAKGKYWYEYRSVDLEDRTLDVIWLERSKGENIAGLFIEE